MNLFKSIKSKLSEANVLSIGIFAEHSEFDVTKENLNNLKSTFDSRKVRFKKKHIHSYADPFLYVEKDELYLFAEVQEIGGKGYINCWKSSDAVKWDNLGIVLKKDFHISYPFLLELNSELYLLPETSEANEIALYKFNKFPLELKKEKILLKGIYVDSNIVFWNNTFFLLTMNKKKEMELYFTEDLLKQELQAHPLSPIVFNPKINRNGGCFIRRSDKLIRIAQDFSKNYFDKIVILEILELNRLTFKEKLVRDSFEPEINFLWQRLGRHHLSAIEFKGKTLIAMDGRQKDTNWNRIINPIFKILN